MSTNIKIPSYNPKYNSFNNEFLSFIFKDDAKESIYKNKPHFYGLIQYTKHKVLVLGCTELMTWIATALARNNAVTYITHEKELYEKFIKTVNDFNFGGDDVGILCENINDYINKLQDLKDMKFDKVIMNPPFGKNKTLTNNIVANAYNMSNSVISIQPCPEIENRRFKSKTYKLPEVYNYITDITYIIDNPFIDAKVNNSMFIMEFSKSKKPIENIKFYFLSDMECKLFGKICHYEDVLKDHIKPGTERGNIPLERLVKLKTLVNNGKDNWDYLNIYSPNKFEKDEYDMWFIETDEPEKMKRFLDSDILLFAMYLTKSGAHTDNCFDYVPFDESLDEAVLIKKLNLTDEEVAYIHEKMKKFGYKARPKK